MSCKLNKKEATNLCSLVARNVVQKDFGATDYVTWLTARASSVGFAETVATASAKPLAATLNTLDTFRNFRGRF
jgi:hypothetical protein